MEDHHQVNQTLNHLFRQESGKMVSVLVKIFGSENFELAEDVVQEALLRAMENWKFNGIPDNPRAWLYKTARNKAIDILRKERHNEVFDFMDPERKLLSSEYTLSTSMDKFFKEESINDDFLGMMYACCHPELSSDQQITFILKSLCGFSTREISKAFLTSEETITKRLYRTKQYFRKTRTKPRIPEISELPSRTNSVLGAIYLLFNEGYNSTQSEELVRQDLIEQAIYLCKSLAENNRTHLPETYAMLALMYFHSARSQTRISADGHLIPLDKQDRKNWDQEKIKLGNQYMNQAAFGDKITPYHLEAAIAFEHSTAPSYPATNWSAILNYYDHLLKLIPDPIIFLNRCIVIMELKGPEAAFSEMETLKGHKKVRTYYLYHATLGEIYRRMGEKELAIAELEKSQKLTLSKKEQRFLLEKISII